MNIILFVHGKASAGKDSFVKSLKANFLKHSEQSRRKENFLYEEETFVDPLADLFADKPSLFDEAPIEIISFNQGVYEELARLNPEVDLQRLQNDYAYKSKYRKELVAIGDGYRQENPEIWIQKHFSILKKKCKTEKNKIYVCPSVRYWNEVQYSKNVNSYIDNLISFSIKINASLGTRLCRMPKDGILKYMKVAKENPSETDLDFIPEFKFDFSIDNNENFESESLILGLNELVFGSVQTQILQIRDKIIK